MSVGLLCAKKDVELKVYGSCLHDIDAEIGLHSAAEFLKFLRK